jgi:UDP-N-acetylmuramoyl-tripeptide--D-alanyl-D-alanine ligase
MKKVITIIFPYNLYLHIFQLERYDISRFFNWLKSNWRVRSNQNKKPLVTTKKINSIKTISVGWFVILAVITTFIYPLLAILIVIILILQPYVLIVLSIISLKPYEFLNRKRIINITRNKIKSLKHTKVIGIAGSYAKTSVKDILFHILKTDFKVIKTPLSYNTIFGIAQVVDFEIDDSHDYFLCELGEFQKGDIKEMCEMVIPTYGILTGINDQHLERFKHIKNTISTIFELADYLKKSNQKTVANGLNSYIKEETSIRNSEDFILYSTEASSLQATEIHFSNEGMTFTLKYQEKTYHAKTALLGYAHLNNILGAMTLGIQLGAPIDTITKRLETLPHVPHRFDQKTLPNGLLLIDNSYSSNSDSFKESLNILEGLKVKNKILVTPGMVELGNVSNTIHQDLGSIANKICSHIILVGKSDRTEALASRIDASKVIWMDDIRNLWGNIEKLGINTNETAVLLENDLPDNY